MYLFNGLNDPSILHVILALEVLMVKHTHYQPQAPKATEYE